MGTTMEKPFRPVAAAWVCVGPNSDNQLFVRLQEPKVEFEVPQYPYTVEGSYMSNIDGVVKIGYINARGEFELMSVTEANKCYRDYTQLVDVTYLSNGYISPSMYAGHATLRYAEAILKAFNLPFGYKRVELDNGDIFYILLSNHFLTQDLVGTRFMSREHGEVRVEKHYLTHSNTECYMVKQVEHPHKIYHLDARHQPEVHPALNLKQLFEDYKNKTGLIWPE